MQRYLLSLGLLVACEEAETPPAFSPTPTGSFTALLGGLGVEVGPQGAAVHSGESGLTLTLSKYGRRGELIEAPDAPPVLALDGRVLQAHDAAITAWWAARASNLQQGWTLSHAVGGIGPLVLEVCAEGAQVQGTADPLRIVGADGQAWRYRGLAAWDADGNVLAAEMRGSGACARITVDDQGARYPVTVDPILDTEETHVTASDAQDSDHFGQTIASADFNGDGYDDLLVGADVEDETASKAGAAYVYYGSASGILTSTEQKLLASDGAVNDYFGAGAGTADVNGDGYHDVVVGARGQDTNASSDGAAYIFYGSSAGIRTSTEQSFTPSDSGKYDNFAANLSTAGDIDGDGFEELIFSSSYNDEAATDAGAAYVYFGSSTGADTASLQKLTASDAAASDRLGKAVAGGGDLNGDGYADVIVGATGAEAAYIFYGSLSGIDTSTEQKISASSGASGDNYGTSVAAGGDLDGDGYADVIVGANQVDSSTAVNIGAAYVYYGTASGIDTTTETALRASDAAREDNFGGALSIAGDIDDDGYADLVVGASENGGGYAYVYLGAATGLSSASEQIVRPSGIGGTSDYGASLAFGDVDGDGDSDLIAGAPREHLTYTDEGGVYVFPGDPDTDRDGIGVSTDCDDTDDSVGAPSLRYVDSDSDGYGDPDDSAEVCPAQAGYVDNALDCDDTDSAISPSATEICDSIDNDCDGTVDEPDAVGADTWYADDDGDTYGDPDSTTPGCTEPSGYVSDDTDCDDADAGNHPGADETCDGEDNDCDGSTDEDDAVDASTWHEDDDSDGYGDSGDTTEACDQPSGYVADSTDCDDSDSSINPDADETCDGDDNDCDGSTDEDSAIDADTWYADDDGDTYGDSADTAVSCSQPSGYVSDDTDCDDANDGNHPGADETCDSEDNDCDGTIDEDDAVDASTWYEDDDGDGYGDPADSAVSCEAASGYIADGSDCDDADAANHPGADEVCDSADNDCDGTVDEDDAVDASTWYEDDDSDGYGDAWDTTEACDQPSGYVADSTDCDDSNGSTNPGADEVCDSADNDCDGTVDEDDAADASTWYEDGDEDGFGDRYSTAPGCDAPSGYVSDDTDCDDDDSSINPDAEEVPYDGVDDDCDGSDLIDADGDGTASDTSGGTDCNDNDSSIYPGATETADGADEDCDGTIDEGTVAYDDDGDGYTENGGDCDDTDAAVSPKQTEVAGNGIDDDCDGTVDDGAYDIDGDGYLPDGGDCDDDDSATHPGAAELADGVDNDCDGTVDEGTVAYDDDGDGYSEEAGDCNDGNAKRSPDASEEPDGIDNDCDELVDEGTDMSDDDGDGFTEAGGDCDDDDSTTHPGISEIQDGIDNDCDGLVDEGTAAYDDDGDGYSEEDGDCDDEDGWVGPDAAEACDNIDNDCDGEVDNDCVVEEGESTAEPSAGLGCSAAAGSTSALGWLLGAALIGLRRRRRSLAAVAVVSAGCTSNIETNLSYNPRHLEASPRIEAGTLLTGETHTIEIPVQSTGAGIVNISDITLSSTPEGAFEMATWEPQVPAGDILPLVLTYTPTEAGWHNAQITVFSDAYEEELAVMVTAYAAAPAGRVWPHLIDFGPVGAGDSERQTITLRNDGVVDLTMTGWSATVEGVTLSPAELTLRPEEQRAMEVYLAPGSDAPIEGELWLELAGVDAGLSVALLGNACGEGEPALYDADGDGFAACAGDCDDDDDRTNPAAREILDETDNDCDGTVDEGTAAYDDDGDGRSELGGDCNDSDAAIGPDAAEDMSNGIDDDCDGVVDYGSEDGDGDGYTEDGGDCDDTDATSHPGAAELEDGLDNDCDGTTDEGTAAYDDDGDSFSENDGDCDDTDAGVHPDASELQDWLDNDCDGTIDEGTDSYDDDGDGYTEYGGDCDDTDASASPAEVEVDGDGVDNDCDGETR